MKLHGTLASIVSDRDAWFIARVWKEFQETLDNESKLSTTFQSQTDGRIRKYHPNITRFA